MNHNRNSRPFLICLMLVICGLSAQSHADLSPGAFTSPSPALIDPFVNKEVALLSGADPERWAGARSALIGEAVKKEATPGFFSVYAASLNTALLPLTKNKDARIRLNAAIVAARVAARANSADLAPVALALLKDQSEGVVLWGLQTTKYIVPAALGAKPGDDLAKAALDVAKNHAKSVPIIEEVYRTLLLDPTLPAGSSVNYINTLSPGAISAFLPNVMAMYDFRIGLYDSDAPAQPLTDTWCTSFLVTGKVWAAQSDAQKAQTVNAMLALLKGADKQRQNAANQSPEMLDVMKRTGQAFEVAFRGLNKPALMSAANAIATLTPATPDAGPLIATLETQIRAAGYAAPAAP